MTRLVIVADDLTGAADSAATLTTLGTTSVVLDAAAPWPTDEVLAVDTDSRHRDPDDAAARVADVSRRARGLGARVVKKIDSTLRGHVAVELQAVLGALDERTLLVVAPAFPATGRTTVGGVAHVDGERLAAHGSDGDVVALLEHGGLRTRLLRPGTDLPDRLVDAHADGLAAVVVDAIGDDDLRRVVDAADSVEVPVLLVGSGGLTRRLAPEDVAAATEPPALRAPVLVVVGSYAGVSRGQRQRLLDHGHPAVLLDEDDPHETAARLREALRTGSAVLSPDPDAPVVRSDAPRVAQALAATVGAVVPDLGTLVATGGETARAVLTAAGVTRLQVTGEVEPGVVRGRVPELDLDVVTKAGGFGDPDTLLRCAAHPVRRTPEEERTP